MWREYREARPDGYGYSQCCELYRKWKARRSPVMLQEHKAGEKVFVDYAGQAESVWNAECAARVFVAVLGASAYCHAEASWGQDEESRLGSHVCALEFFGGSTEILVPDYVPGNIIGVKDFWLSSAGVDAIGSLVSLDWIAGSGQIGRLAAGSGNQDRDEWALAASLALPTRMASPADRPPKNHLLWNRSRPLGVGVRHYALD